MLVVSQAAIHIPRFCCRCRICSRSHGLGSLLGHREPNRAREGIRGTYALEKEEKACPTLGQLPTSILPKPVRVLSRAEVDLLGPTFSDFRLLSPQHIPWYIELHNILCYWSCSRHHG